MDWKPEGHNSLSPYLVVDDAQAVLDFAAAAFDAREGRVIRHSDNAIRHAECRIDDTVLMIGQMPGGAPAHVHLYAPDAEAAFARALDAGGTQVLPMEDAGDGDLRGGVRDPSGTTWWIARQLRPAAD